MTETPTMWNKDNPNLQMAFDATSLSAFQFCPRYYQYTIKDGYRAGGLVDLEFGILIHHGKEVYERALLDGKSKFDAQVDAVRAVVERSGHYTEEGEWVPWGGHYETQWRCTGTEPYKNPKGNRAKCPYSHAGRWFIEPAPHVCGECGSDTETERRWIPWNKYKDRAAAVRMIAWYIEEQPELDGELGMKPYKFPDGTPALELPFRVPLPWTAKNGEPFVLAGYIDAIKEMGEEKFWTDFKTTKKALGKQFWDSYSPNTQFDIYDLVASVLFPNLHLKGMIEGAQVLVEGARFGKHSLYRTEAQREELWRELEWWLRLVEKCAEEGHWPMNRRNCWMCPFKGVCSKDPSRREAILEANFEKRHWNPLEDR